MYSVQPIEILLPLLAHLTDHRPRTLKLSSVLLNLGNACWYSLITIVLASATIVGVVLLVIVLIGIHR